MAVGDGRRDIYGEVKTIASTFGYNVRSEAYRRELAQRAKPLRDVGASWREIGRALGEDKDAILRAYRKFIPKKDQITDVRNMREKKSA